MIKIMLLSFLLLSFNVYSHGMSSSGPHDGNIAMPANYHIELIVKNNIKIYFLDIALKEMKLKDTYLKVSTVNQNTKTELNCHKNESKNYYECKINKQQIKGVNQIEVESSITKNKKYKSIYNLPLPY